MYLLPEDRRRGLPGDDPNGARSQDPVSILISGTNPSYRLRYKFPDHPEAPLYKELGERYKKLSEEQTKKQENLHNEGLQEKKRERKLDLEFERRLKSIDMVDDEKPDAPSNPK